VTLGSCRDMMAAVKPPRSVFLDFPLGRPCGKPDDIPLQTSILRDTLNHLVTAARPGEMLNLPYQWDTAFGWSDFMKDLEEMIKLEGAQKQVWKPEKKD